MLITDKVLLANAKPVASTNYQYRVVNATWGVVATSGVVDCSAHNHRQLSFKVATMTAGSVGYRIEGRNLTNSYSSVSSDRWADVYTASKTAAMTIDEIINIVEPFDELRVGWRCAPAPTATADNVLYADVFLAEER